MMPSLGRRYVRHVNVHYQRTGTLWEGRYRAAPIETDAYFLACSRYIELNPVRARIVTDPAAWRWSSFHASALGTRDVLVEFHPLYLGLGASPKVQQASYRALFTQALDDTFLDGLRAATNGGWAFGNDRFQQEVSAMAGRRSTPLPPGRRAEVKDDESQRMLL